MSDINFSVYDVAETLRKYARAGVEPALYDSPRSSRHVT